jgi:hypothetical protein
MKNKLIALMNEAGLLPDAQEYLLAKLRGTASVEEMTAAVAFEKSRMENVRARFRPNLNSWFGGAQ